MARCKVTCLPDGSSWVCKRWHLAVHAHGQGDVPSFRAHRISRLARWVGTGRPWGPQSKILTSAGWLSIHSGLPLLSPERCHIGSSLLDQDAQACAFPCAWAGWRPLRAFSQMGVLRQASLNCFVTNPGAQISPGRVQLFIRCRCPLQEYFFFALSCCRRVRDVI